MSASKKNKAKDDLSTPRAAASHLNAILTDPATNRKAYFLQALREIASAKGFSDVARNSQLSRESMYRALSSNGNPELETITQVLDALGLRISISEKK